MVAPRRELSGHRQAGYTAKSMDSRNLRAAPFRMLPRVCAPAQAPEVEVLCVAEKVPQLHEKLSDTCRSRKTVMCLRPHCGQRVRTVYLAPDFAVSSHAGEDFIFVTRLVEFLERRTDLESLF